jgi:hypothetical protein
MGSPTLPLPRTSAPLSNAQAAGTPESEIGEAPPVSTPTSRWWDLLGAFLLLAALFTLSGRLIATDWVDNLSITRLLILLGAIAGLALGQSRFSPRVVIFFGLAYGLFAVSWQLGLTLEYVPGEGLWSDRLLILLGRLFIGIDRLVRQEAVYDPMLFLAWMTSLFWTLGVYTGYSLTRHGHAWRTILPGGVTLLLIHNSDPYVAPQLRAFAIYLCFSLMLVARLTYLHNRVRWQQSRTYIPPLVALDFAQVILLVSVVLVAVAWLVPVVADALPAVREAWKETIDPLTSAISELTEKAFASLRRTVVAFVAADYYGDSLSLGRGSELTDTLVLTAQSPPGARASGIRHYWRARVYDHYADGQWSSVTFSTTQSIKPTGLGLTFPELEGRRVFTFTFTTASPIVTLYAAPQPQWVSLPAQVDLALNLDGTADVGALRVAPPLAAGMSYEARSSLSAVTIAQLRAAGTDYPSEVTDRYLQLPATVTTRTRELAREIVVDLDSPYDMVDAITNYLRETIEYTETIPPPPGSVAGESGGQELLDWFLFDLRRGFCNYYASAEVIMLRSLGIPARLAVGFAEGERQSGTDVYLVRRRDAHAWPEVYFPGLGWIEFEPTVSQRRIDRPLGEGEDDSETGRSAAPGGAGEEYFRDPLDRLMGLEDEAFPEGGMSGEDVGSRKLWVSWVVALAALSALLVPFVQRSRRRRGAPPFLVLLEKGIRRVGLQPPKALRVRARRVVLSPLAQAYLEINQALARLNEPPTPADTPSERAAALAGVLPVAEKPAQRLLGEYHTTAYGPQLGNLYVAQRSARAIRRLSWQARIRRLISRQHKPDPSA